MRRMIHSTKEILSFIVAYKSSHDGNSPTLRQIGHALDISSTSVVSYHVKKLKDLGLIDTGAYRARSIRVKGGNWEKS